MSPDREDHLEAGQTIGRYRILRPLGAGAMGRVYLAQDPRIERYLAIKTVRVEGRAGEVEERKRRLLREAKAAGRLLHPHVVTLFDAGEEGDTLFLAFEYVDGSDLAARLEAGPPLALGQALEVARQAAEALGFAHARGVIHRDIKPSNLLLDAAGRVKVSDFGIAKLAGQSTELTMTGSVVGSPHYLSPEQIRGDELDGRSDLFSLGVVLYEMLSRRRPFDADTLTTLIYQILHQEPPPLTGLELPAAPHLKELLGRLLAKDREDRPADAAAVAAELAAIHASLTPAQRAAPPPGVAAGAGAAEVAPAAGEEETRRVEEAGQPGAEPSAAEAPGRRRGVWWAAAAVVVVLLAVVAGGAAYLGLWPGGGASPGAPAPEAATEAEGGGPEAAGEPGTAIQPGALAEREPGSEPEAGAASQDLARRDLDQAGAEAPGGVEPGTSRQGAAPSPLPAEAPAEAQAEATQRTEGPHPRDRAPASGAVAEDESAAGPPGQGGEGGRSGSAASETTPPPSPEPSPAAAGDEPDRRADRTAPPEPAVAFDRRLDTGLTIRFAAEPDDAFVLVDGTVVGRAAEINAAGGYRLPSPGEHLVVVRKPGRRDARLLLTAHADAGTTVVPVRLRYLPAAALALGDLPIYRVREAVAFAVEPKNAVVFVDGVPRGRAAKFGGLGRGWLRLRRGRHRLSFTAPGHRRVDVALEVSAGASERRRKIELTLPREEP